MGKGYSHPIQLQGVGRRGLPQWVLLHLYAGCYIIICTSYMYTEKYTSDITEIYLYEVDTVQQLKHCTKVGGTLPHLSHSWGDTCSCCPTASRASEDNNTQEVK